jgi:serpin B
MGRSTGSSTWTVGLVVALLTLATGTVLPSAYGSAPSRLGGASIGPTGSSVLVNHPAPFSENGLASSVARDEQAFSLDLLKRLGQTATNVVLSPSSIATGLAMLEAGASGSTQAGIARALHSVGLTAADLSSGWFALNGTISRQASPFGIVLATANGLWLQKGYPARASYTRLLATDFGARAQEQNFHGDPAAAARAIDNWVSSRTAGHITRLLRAQDVQDAVAVLTNAIYFQARWGTPFDPTLTSPGPFHVSAAKTVTVPLMETPEPFSALASAGPGLDIAEFDYKGGHLSALAIMPPLGQMGVFESKLTAAGLEQIIARLRYQPADITLPRFSLNNSLHLEKVLSAMGMSQAFGPSADFSPLSPKTVSVSSVVHDAQVEVGEKGTEASAATAVVAPGAAAPGTTIEQVRIVFDHPFLFLVRDNASGTIIFAAQVTNPSTS